MSRSASTGRDKITIRGALPVPSGFQFEGEAVVFNIGGITEQFVLSAKGAGKQVNASFKFARAKNGQAKFRLTLSGAFVGKLADEGLIQDVAGYCSVPVQILFNGDLFEATREISYSANNNKGRGK